MLKFLLSLFILFSASLGVQAQQARASAVNFNGQWKGGFQDGRNAYADNNDDYVYVLELTTQGSKVSGYSYTYFNGMGKRYYTICRLTGTLDRAKNKLVVTEIERTKYNTPPGFQNCFQIHILQYERDNNSDSEFLKGTWIPAPKQSPGCGSGYTVLSRRIVNRTPFGISPTIAHKKKASPAPKKETVSKPHKVSPPIVKNTQVDKPKILKPLESIEQPNLKADEKINSQTKITESTPRLKGFEERKRNVVKTISISQPVFQLDFYDNGEIDGDSISVFYNNKLVLSHKRLSDKPITLKLALNPDVKENIVTMYADNLGTIPPNTAVMVVTDGDKRYEVRMESDLGKSGSVSFVREQK
ncbi:MAG: hypothetical protein ABI168_05975 [Ginsengibacter sp.]